jgi:pyridoxine 4-dehydrogenase
MSISRTVTLGERELTRMGLGTNRLTHTPEDVELVRGAVDAGIGLVDTAHLYTGGESEATIGEALGSTDRAIVATKGGYSPGEGRPEALRAQIEQSLRSLRTGAIDLYYLHRVDPQTPLEVSLGTIREFVERGRIRLVGLSQVSVETIERARRVAPIAAVQNHYNLAERGFDDVVDYCAAEGIVFVPFFPLRGLGNSLVRRIAEQRGVSPQQIALAWLLHRSPAILPIPGTLAPVHLRENLAALDIELNDTDLDALGRGE